MPVFIGVDPGLERLGFICLFKGNQTSRIIHTKRSLPGVVGDVFRCEELRCSLATICSSLEDSPGFSAASRDGIFVSVEGPSFGRCKTGTVQTGALHSAVYRGLQALPVAPDVVLTVPPMTLKKYVSGNGKSDKKMMKAAIEDLYGVRFTRDDLYDAFALAKCSEGYYKQDESICEKVESFLYRDGTYCLIERL